ncbi:barrier-to-autointegration factor B-like [Haliotis cracherodii]|uniref:barrier-to-autointegration factor B-like n=1 Tax=Haliotis cracherodii TaxID=6455 RepID=UPI0039E96FB0
MAEQPGPNDPTTSQKHKSFGTNSMKGKLVAALPGIGDTYGANLKKNGYDLASQVYGQFLVLKTNEEDFALWLYKTAKVDEHKAKKCYNALKEWYDRFG